MCANPVNPINHGNPINPVNPVKFRGFVALLSILAVWVALDPSLALSRDLKARKAFTRSNPCPSTGKTAGRCPGFVVDHVKPLCAGGLDAPVNMQWQELEASKAKDRQEREQCRTLKRIK